eukprot:GHVU01007353.1.p3 GENE.GHVU01007353.1~~GHVU01007353.1.p3  ORF type:complete len:111 (-),score=20.67 GHVU01007353.1:484-816(-)
MDGLRASAVQTDEDLRQATQAKARAGKRVNIVVGEADSLLNTNQQFSNDVDDVNRTANQHQLPANVRTRDNHDRAQKAEEGDKGEGERTLGDNEEKAGNVAACVAAGVPY